MKFYRRLKPFKAISFDLDDTLYSNRPIMLSIDTKMATYFTNRIPTPNDKRLFDSQFWWLYRQQALTHNHFLIHDVVALRLESYSLGFKSLGFSPADAKREAQVALNYFTSLRSNFTVAPRVHHLLASLQKKWPLVAISNGNVDTQAIGLSQYFSATFHAGRQTEKNAELHYRQKPHHDMFVAACNELSIKPEELLHVGDCGRSDIFGAHSAGCQSVWLSCFEVGKPLSILPNIELSDVVELHGLI
ncbi:MAG: HAD superfamily hydrolase (TIGR01549 family) [Alteromonadaceae bacterium]|jgi:HAD superfamily hydrolase (TIGR01549 family)